MRVFTLECQQLEYRKDNVQFTFELLKVFFIGLEMATPLLIFMALMIVLLGQIAGQRESWNRFDALYWSFITETTVGYGDIRPTQKLSRVLSILIVFASSHEGVSHKTVLETTK